ncbi:uncharacterized protein DSM5745_09950 [Aspergillus mulundensis]|uniref:Uncharacterized protein n=1 Tax=Aspergillus mulundensis TaxID=1810919 RepID=A0A3D8QRV1_9EURO|nr:hypothetical protein DSM5745_09950 [Aspergillus mulundensis]RDW64539.1 hypothetical protein DSM5745_09950 [Aspergillus mulundensis]
MSALTLQFRPDNSERMRKDEVERNYNPWDAFQAICRYLDPDAAVALPLDELLSILYQMLPIKTKRWSTEEADLSYLILDVVEQIPHAHPGQDKMLALYQRLAKCDKFIYQREPRESCAAFEEEAHRRIIYWPWEKESQARAIVNSCAFMARLEGAGLLDPSFKRGFFFQDALDDPKAEMGKEPLYDSYLLAACAMWILYDTGVFFRCVSSGRQWHDPDRSDPTGLEQWNKWQRVFAERAETSDLTDEARQLARQAADRMAALAREGEAAK